MNTATSLSIDAFLDRFFNAPNKLTRDSKSELPHWIARITRPDPLSTVLPCWRESGVVDWYGLAFDDRQFRALGESLTAFVGPSYTNFRGQIAQLNGVDPIDQVVQELTHGRAYRFQGSDPKAIWTALERMRKVIEQAGPREHAAPAPVGRVLRDFHMAIRAGLESDATATLTLLRDEYHLDGLNLLFLRVELLASFSRWQTLLDLPDLPDLLRLRKPVAVTEALLRAVYHCYLVEFESSSSPEDSVQAFESNVLPRFGSLVANRSGMRSSEAAKSFMLLAATQPPQDAKLLQGLLTGWELSENDHQYLTRLSTFVRTSAKSVDGVPLDLANDAARAGDFDRALALLREIPVSPKQARLLCECAFELNTLDSRAAAIAAVDNLSDGDRIDFLRSRLNQNILQGIQDIGGNLEQEASVEIPDSVPTDWETWLNYLEQYEGRRGAREIAHRGASEWSISELLSRPDGATTLAEKLQDLRSPLAERALRDSLPHLLAFFQRDDKWPNPAFRDVYRTLFDRLYLSTEGSRSDLIVFSELLECLLSVGLTAASEYYELIQCAADLCHRFTAPATFDYAIDLVGVLVNQPCQNSEARLLLLDNVLESLQKFSRHVRADQRALLDLLANDLGAPLRVAEYLPTPAASPQTISNPLVALCSMSVAIYSLTESASRQVQQILESTYSGVKVLLNHDLAGTTRLKQLARQSDLFVMVTASAKHAATEFITANRPKPMPILRPAGKGAASMLAAIRDHFYASE